MQQNLKVADEADIMRLTNPNRSTDVSAGSKSYKISFLSKHTLPDKGFSTRDGSFKAYSTVVGGVLYMLVR